MSWSYPSPVLSVKNRVRVREKERQKKQQKIEKMKRKKMRMRMKKMQTSLRELDVLFFKLAELPPPPPPPPLLANFLSSRVLRYVRILKLSAVISSTIALQSPLKEERTRHKLQKSEE